MEVLLTSIACSSVLAAKASNVLIRLMRRRHQSPGKRRLRSGRQLPELPLQTLQLAIEIDLLHLSPSGFQIRSRMRR